MDRSVRKTRIRKKVCMKNTKEIMNSHDNHRSIMIGWQIESRKGTVTIVFHRLRFMRFWGL